MSTKPKMLGKMGWKEIRRFATGTFRLTGTQTKPNQLSGTEIGQT